MAEGNANVEIAHRMHEGPTPPHEGARHAARREQIFEIGEAVLLALVAIATAWSGYQAARWDGRSAELYGHSSTLRVTAEGDQAAAGQELLYDAAIFNSWLTAKQAGDEKLASFLEAHFRPEYRVAFDAWIKTDPFNNPAAPAGPILMPEYHNRLEERAVATGDQATRTFDSGMQARHVGEEFVRITVVLAVVLFLIAISQRFAVFGVRVGLLGVAVALLGFCLYSLATFPRLI
jgi:hypothetical protein